MKQYLFLFLGAFQVGYFLSALGLGAVDLPAMIVLGIGVSLLWLTYKNWNTEIEEKETLYRIGFDNES